MKTAIMIMAAAAIFTAPAHADEALAKSRGCMACHQIDKKVVGPAYKDVATKNKTTEQLATSILKGSKGQYGPVPMPANRIVESEAIKLAAWINTLK